MYKAHQRVIAIVSDAIVAAFKLVCRSQDVLIEKIVSKGGLSGAGEALGSRALSRDLSKKEKEESYSCDGSCAFIGKHILDWEG